MTNQRSGCREAAVHKLVTSARCNGKRSEEVQLVVREERGWRGQLLDNFLKLPDLPDLMTASCPAMVGRR